MSSPPNTRSYSFTPSRRDGLAPFVPTTTVVQNLNHAFDSVPKVRKVEELRYLIIPERHGRPQRAVPPAFQIRRKPVPTSNQTGNTAAASSASRMRYIERGDAAGPPAQVASSDVRRRRRDSVLSTWVKYNAWSERENRSHDQEGVPATIRPDQGRFVPTHTVLDAQHPPPTQQARRDTRFVPSIEQINEHTRNNRFANSRDSLGFIEAEQLDSNVPERLLTYVPEPYFAPWDHVCHGFRRVTTWALAGGRTRG